MAHARNENDHHGCCFELLVRYELYSSDGSHYSRRIQLAESLCDAFVHIKHYTYIFLAREADIKLSAKVGGGADALQFSRADGESA